MEELTLAQLIENSFKSKLSFTEKEKELFNSSFEKFLIKKNEYTIQEGNIERYVYFVESGILRYWIYDINLREITFWFSLAGEFANSYLSLENQIPSEFNIQALDNCTLWRIERENINKYFLNSLVFNRVARLVLEDALTRKIKREICLLKYKGKDRYKLLVLLEKELVKNVPLKYLASYLGITPQSLSRIRSSPQDKKR